jgi:DNA-directed RNA polymerase subunit F
MSHLSAELVESTITPYCGNTLVGRIDVIDAELLAALQEDVLRPSVVDRAVALALAELAPERQQETRQGLEAERRAVVTERGQGR